MKNINIVLLIIAFICVIAVGIKIVNPYLSGIKNYAKTNSTKVFEPDALKKEASLMSHYFLKKKLKVPATAKFPANESRDVTYFERDSIFFVDSYLDAKNACGALLRESFFAKMKYKGKGKWLCLKVEMIAQ